MVDNNSTTEALSRRPMLAKVLSGRKVLYFLNSLSQGSAWSLLHIHVVRVVIGRCIILLAYV